mgnify:CR=1 FL=1
MAREVECFWHAPSFAVALVQMTADQNPYGDLANSAQEAMQHHNQLSRSNARIFYVFCILHQPDIKFKMFYISVYTN